MRSRTALLVVAALLLAAAPAHAHGTAAPQARAAQAAQAAQLAMPPATPRARCGPGSDPETDIQGRVPPGAPGREDGFRCNTEQAGHVLSAGGYKALRYVDEKGRECAYYDTTLLFPTNAVNLSESPTGVAVLDMSDPANPKRTASLLTPAMQTPHESLVLNQRRGLIVAVMGNPTQYPGVVDIYDASKDCRNPVLRSSTPLGYLGHESGFAPDGNTFYSTSIGTGDVTALDVSDPALPKVVWRGRYASHGLSVGDDGDRLYLADGDLGLVILDSTEIQARKPDPQVREISRLTWPEMTIPQIAHPVTIGGRPYVVEMDEFAETEDGDITADGAKVGAARIIDISDETKPRVVSSIRLEVNQPENRAAVADDPGTFSPVQGYAGHYCNVPRREDPGIVACSFILSGLRVFDIRDPLKPKEIAYFVAPPSDRASPGQGGTNYAMSSPEFVPERSEIWYTDGGTGFYNVRLTNGVWPFAGDPEDGAGSGGGAAPSCTSTAGLRSVSAVPRGSRLRIGFTKRDEQPIEIDVFQVARRGRVVRERRVARFAPVDGSFTWNSRVPDGTYFVRFSMIRGGERVDVRRIVLRRRGGRFVRVPGHHQRAVCGLLRQFKLYRPVFGSRRATPLRIAYRLRAAARVSVVVTRGKRVVKRFPAGRRRPGQTYRLVVPARRLPKGDYRVRLVAVGSGDRVVATLRARRI